MIFRESVAHTWKTETGVLVAPRGLICSQKLKTQARFKSWVLCAMQQENTAACIQNGDD